VGPRQVREQLQDATQVISLRNLMHTTPIERIIQSIARLNLRNLSPMQVNNPKKRKHRSPTTRRSPGGKKKRTKH